MPTRKYKWQTSDKVAAEMIDKMVEESGLALRDIEEKSGGMLNFLRVRYLRKGLKAPVRLSEFLMICDICGKDSVDVLAEIIDESKKRDALHAQQLHDESDADAILKSFIEGDPHKFETAALHDENQQQESQGGDGR
jgi:hypothetical protein